MINLQDQLARGLGTRAKQFLDVGNPMAALALLREAKRLSTDPAWPRLLIGDVAQQLGDPGRARACYEDVIAMAPDTPGGTQARAKALEWVGRWEEAAADEATLTADCLDQVPVPLWHGERTDHLAITFTGSIGNAFFFARWLPLARARCRLLTILVAPELVEFFQAQPVDCRVVAIGGASFSATAVQSAHRLQAMFPHTTHELPSPPYLRPAAPPFRSLEGGLKVGIEWAGSRRHPAHACRSSRLEAWAPVFGVAGVTFYSL